MSSDVLIVLPFYRPHRFCNEIRAEGSNSSVLQGETDVTKQSTLLAQAWKALTEEERKVSNPTFRLIPITPRQILPYDGLDHSGLHHCFPELVD